jgi:hypothetical protein
MNTSSAGLFKEREQFIKRQAEGAAALAPAEKRQKVDKPSSQKTNRPKSGINRSKTSSDFTNDYHTPKNSTSTPKNYKLATIVDKLKERYLSGQTEPVTLDEIILEADLQIDSHDRHWLASEALLSRERIDVKRIDDVNKFVYKPPLNLKGRKPIHLLNFLKARHEKCEGAVTVDDVRDTIPKAKADKIIDNLIESGDVVKVTSNKKEVLFYTDRPYNLRVHPKFVESWRKISVEGSDDDKIWKFLNDHGYFGIMKTTPRFMLPTKPSRRGGRRPNTMKHNDHVAGQLIDYSNQTETK